MPRFKDTFEQLLARANTVKPRRHPDDVEHRIQCACVQWLRYQYPKYAHNLFAVPNGGKRDKVTAAKMKAEGAQPGVADLLFLKPNSRYHALCIEMKTDKGRQSDTQRKWQQLIEQDGYKYVIIRSLSEFMKEIEDYLSE